MTMCSASRTSRVGAYQQLLREPVYANLSRRLLAKLRETGLIAQLLRFGTIGTAGFVIDTAIVYALVGKLGLYGAGLVSYLVAASWCWGLNRAWTFRGRSRRGFAHHQWAKYLTLNLTGLILNRGTYSVLVTVVPFCATQPVFAVAGGAVAGVLVNFTLSRQVVFR
jgi:putative flippase GtrA